MANFRRFKLVGDICGVLWRILRIGELLASSAAIVLPATASASLLALDGLRVQRCPRPSVAVAFESYSWKRRSRNLRGSGVRGHPRFSGVRGLIRGSGVRELFVEAAFAQFAAAVSEPFADPAWQRNSRSASVRAIRGSGVRAIRVFSGVRAIRGSVCLRGYPSVQRCQSHSRFVASERLSECSAVSEPFAVRGVRAIRGSGVREPFAVQWRPWPDPRQRCS